jgi:PAS domain S-box-containing protein
MRRFSFAQIQGGLAGLALLATIISTHPEDIPSALDLFTLLVAAGLVAVCTRYPIVLKAIELSFSHIIGLGMLFSYGVTPAAWTMILGLAVGEGLWLAVPSTPVMENRPARLSHPAAHFAQHTLPLLIGGAIYRWLGGEFPLTAVSGTGAIALGVFALVYFGLYNLWLVWQVSSQPAAGFLIESAGAISLAQFLPLPLQFFAVMQLPVFGPSLLVAYGSVLTLLTLRLHRTSRESLALMQRANEQQRRADEAERKLESVSRQYTIASARAEVAARNEQALSRRAQQLDALVEIAQQLSAAPADRFPYDAILRKLVEATGAQAGQIGLLDGEASALRFVGSYGLPERARAQFAQWPAERGLPGRALHSGQPVRVANVYADAGYVEVVPGIRSEMCLPLMAGERRLGLIRLFSRQADAFREGEEAFAAQVATALALALDNLRLHSEVATRAREQAVLLETGSRLAATLDIRAIYRSIVQKVSEALAADGATLADYDAPGGVLRLVEPRVSKVYLLAEQPAMARAVSEQRSVAVHGDSGDLHPHDAALLSAENLCTLLLAPMAVGGQVTGLMMLSYHQPRLFTESDLSIAQTLATQAAIAIQNARVFHNVAENRDRLAAILDSTREGVLVVDAGGRISLVNPPMEEHLGLPAQRLINQNMLQLLDESKLKIAVKLGFAREEMEELLLTLRAGLALSIPKTQFAVHGLKMRYFERTGAPVLDQFAKAIGWVIILRDMTEEKELQQVRDTLANMIVHDLRSPLMSMLTGVNLIRDRLPREQQSPLINQAVDVAIRSTKKMIGLVNTLLDIARLEAGELALKLEAIRLNEVAREALEDLMPLANDQGLVLINDISDALPALRADRDKLSRVLMNLVDNALKFSAFGGQVLVQASYRAEDQTILCSVLDSGPGIPDEYRARIFDRFVQVEGRLGRREGTGLGLAFCKLAVEAHGGQIWAENRPEGGSAFHFTLPVQGDST